MTQRICHCCGVGFFGSHRKLYCSGDCRRSQREIDGIAAFWAKVDKGGAGGCWLYTGFRKWDGYGWLNRHRDGKDHYMTAHRYSWILAHGPVPNGLHVLHRCDNPPCCNPSHLFLGTHQENMADRVAKGRAKGAKKLFPDRVRPIRKINVTPD